MLESSSSLVRLASCCSGISPPDRDFTLFFPFLILVIGDSILSMDLIVLVEWTIPSLQ